MLKQIRESLLAKGYDLHNTYVMYVSDHGELKFEHRQVYKAAMYEGSVRVPLQIAGPGIKAQRIDSHIVSLLDIFPTLLDMAGQKDKEAYSNFAGMSLLSVAGGQSAAPSRIRLDANKDNRDLVISH